MDDSKPKTNIENSESDFNEHLTNEEAALESVIDMMDNDEKVSGEKNLEIPEDDDIGQIAVKNPDNLNNSFQESRDSDNDELVPNKMTKARIVFFLISVMSTLITKLVPIYLLYSQYNDLKINGGSHFQDLQSKKRSKEYLIGISAEVFFLKMKDEILNLLYILGWLLFVLLHDRLVILLKKNSNIKKNLDFITIFAAIMVAGVWNTQFFRAVKHISELNLYYIITMCFITIVFAIAKFRRLSFIPFLFLLMYLSELSGLIASILSVTEFDHYNIKHLTQINKSYDSSVNKKINDLILKYGVKPEYVVFKSGNRFDAVTVSDVFESKIFVSNMLKNRFSPEEMMAVLAHELQHSKSKHGLVKAGFNAGISVVKFFGSFLIYTNFEESLNCYEMISYLHCFSLSFNFVKTSLRNLISTSQEYNADQTIITEKLTANGINYLEKLSELQPDKYYYADSMNIILGHPCLKRRIEELKKPVTEKPS